MKNEIAKITTKEVSLMLSQKQGIEQAKQGTQISTLHREGLAVPVIAHLIEYAKTLMDCDLTPAQIVTTAETICQSQEFLKINELVLIFKNGISGKYGKLYGKWNYQKFCEWVQKYSEEEADYFEQRYISKKERPGERIGAKTLRELLEND